MKTIEQQIEDLNQIELNNNEDIREIAQKAISIIRIIFLENKNLKAKLDYVSDTSYERNLELKK